MSLSFSDLNTAQRCLKAHEYRSVRKIQRKVKDAAMHQGTVMHGFLMRGFLNMQSDMDWSSGFEDVQDEYMEADEFGEQADMIQESNYIVQRYFLQADWKGWTVLHVEEEFSVIIDSDTITFTPDLVVRDPNGVVWVVDHKSTSAVPTNGIPFASQQSLLYLAGVQTFYPECAGFLFNFLRKKLPTQPRLNKTKKRIEEFHAIHSLTKIDTEYEILFDFVKHEAPQLIDDLPTRKRLAELRDNPNRFFYQEMVLVTPTALQTIVDDTAMVIENVARAEAEGKFPRTLNEDGGFRSCSKCEFNAICQAEMLDWNTDIVLEGYEPRDPKNPYETED